ncbi:hypothetical protein [Mesoplasma seiffertii]|uniref:hypothetical protein n=1 Tax=Mesoplasma seiffertii TaxID=28224 RepID=UPI00047BB147|nr:hypothetical protein [Mesoplasma seiffertii]
MQGWYWLLIIGVIIFILFIIFIAAIGDSKEKEYFYSKVEAIILENVILLLGEEHIWNDEEILESLKAEIQNSIRDNRKGAYSIRPSVTNRGPRKMIELKKMVSSALERDRAKNFSVSNFNNDFISPEISVKSSETPLTFDNIQKSNNNKIITSNNKVSSSTSKVLPTYKKTSGNKSRIIK